MTDWNDAAGFYSDPVVVEQYEFGRTARVLVPDLPRVLIALRDRDLGTAIPLYSMFDWLYWCRLRSVGLELLTGSVLDVGCGTSYVFRSMMAEGWRGAVTGIDVSPMMLDEGTRRLTELKSSRVGDIHCTNGLYTYQDPLGRQVIDIAAPSASVDVETVEFLLEHRSVGDLMMLPVTRFDHVTALSGPLCFFPADEQAAVFARLCGLARESVSLQFKNAAFARFGQSDVDLDLAGTVIDEAFGRRVVDSLAFLCSLDLRFESGRARENPVVQHEVGGFEYHTMSPSEVRDCADRANFTVPRIATLGFLSEYYFDLVADHYQRAARSPEALLEFFQTLRGVDDYFCVHLEVGDNLHVSAASRKATMVSVTQGRWSAGTNFRSRYRVRET